MKLVVGNWKMNTTLDDAVGLAAGIRARLEDVTNLEVVVCPPFPWLVDVRRALEGSGVKLGAQNVHTQDGGAFTGEVSARMLAGVCQYVLVGQYERRIYFGEKDAVLRQKLLVGRKHGLRPILCVGETADQLDEGSGGQVVTGQVEGVLEDLDPPLDGLVVAYEPVWTTMGLIAPPPIGYVSQMCGIIRDALAYVAPAASDVRVIYGGQINARNIGEIAAAPGVDGILLGAASTHAENFANLARAFVP